MVIQDTCAWWLTLSEQFFTVTFAELVSVGLNTRGKVLRIEPHLKEVIKMRLQELDIRSSFKLLSVRYLFHSDSYHVRIELPDEALKSSVKAERVPPITIHTTNPMEKENGMEQSTQEAGIP